MENYFWLVVLPNLDCFFGMLGIIGLVVSVIGGFIYLGQKTDARHKEDHDNAWMFARSMLKVFAASMAMLFITCFFPTKKDIIQLKIISVVSELKGADQIPQKLVDRLNDILGEETKD